MPGLTGRRAVLIAALIGCVVYANSWLNGWAGDDPLIIPDNPRAHSVRAALQAWFLPYWPPPFDQNGLWRPLTILSYGVDWTLGGGKPWIFHATNVALHTLATALATGVVLAWLPPLGALIAGLLFAVHPVHVEAVSNVVGRAELLAACGLLAAVLCARRYRQAGNPAAARWWLAAALGGLALALFSKEVAAVTVAVIALDHWLDPTPAHRSASQLYVGAGAITLAWFFLWHSIVGSYVASAATTAFFGVTPRERWYTMLPAQLDVVRLLVWPMELSSDYSQQVVPIRTSWTALATLASVLVASVLGLALAVSRRAAAVSFGLLGSVLGYAPTSNFLFASGVVLAERALYLCVLAPAAALGWIVARAEGRPPLRMLLLACGLVLAVFGARAFTRTPFWKNPQSAIIEDGTDHPENYRARLHLGDLFAYKRDTAKALAEYLAAEALAENDALLARFTVTAALTLGRPALAVEEAWRAYRIAPGDARIARLVTQARLGAKQPGEAVAFARATLLLNPVSSDHAETYVTALRATRAPAWRILLAAAHQDWLSGHLVQASARLDSLASLLPPRAPLAFARWSVCPDMAVAWRPISALKPELLEASACGP
ncbi:MAG: hypothetical protein HY560_01790 [Gemmatimonadetes bacterium]|nr:hypothetical protein [Gemmatimonadota bacterium]